MKKLCILIALLSLNACYSAVPASNSYDDDVYIIPKENYDIESIYADNNVDPNVATYTLPEASSSVVYIEKPAPVKAYPYGEPEVVYTIDPLLPPTPIEHQHQRIGSTPHKHIARPIPTPEEIRRREQRNRVLKQIDPAEGRP